MRAEAAEALAVRDADEAADREARTAAALAEHAAAIEKFNADQVADLHKSMAAHRDEAMRRYAAEMAAFREEQLADLAKIDFESGDADDDTDDDDLADLARRASAAGYDAAARPVSGYAASALSPASAAGSSAYEDDRRPGPPPF